ncbi:energy-coupling factor transport system ATP-binding protein [Marinococcus luteus]|uniref:Energy-coupling factor transport system ATP-binding protein n=1 Tax=Marinococcus luteus TaxID=1122204 RepID=A0A1H2V9L9_9BACI|nr:energy-coupling factor transporter ATPase [Marinococcus luteus]SDW64559.1 energy-coupling factor transport system ATP-binding protein [Marinococcus luteus]
MIYADNVTIAYPFAEPSVESFSAEIRTGENVLLLGPSGSGKSTIALAIQGILPRSVEAEVSGILSIFGENPAVKSITEAAGQAALLFQDPDTQFCMPTVREELVFTLENLRVPAEEIEARMLEALQFTDMLRCIDARIDTLSGGMKQKIAVSCLAAVNPQIWILDEPLSQLDPVSREAVASLLGRIAADSDKTLVVIEHQLNEVMEWVDRAIVLNRQGQVSADGSPARIFNSHGDVLEAEGVWLPLPAEAGKNLLKKTETSKAALPITLRQWETFAADYPAATVLESLPQPKKASEPSLQPSVLEVKQAAFAYGTQTVFENVSFSLYPGEMTALVGANGVGKSTLARVLTGWEPPKNGYIYVNGQDIASLKPYEIAKTFGIVFQQPEHQFLTQTVEKEIRYGMEMEGWCEEDIIHKTNELLIQFQLGHIRRNHPFQLSQGEKRRLSVAVMVTNNQSILILDEPTFGLDKRNTDALFEVLEQCRRRGKAVLWLTHDMDLVYTKAARVLALAERTLAYDDGVEAFFNGNTDLEKIGVRPPVVQLMRPKEEKAGSYA